MTYPSVDQTVTKTINSHGLARWFDLPELAAQTCVRHIEFFSQTNSTNDDALRLGSEALHAPLLVLAEGQTAGRGRGSNRWWGSDGALTFSFLIEPAMFGIEAARWPLVSLGTAIAVADLLNEFARGHEIGLKWPNDVHLGGRKVSGILVETVRGRADRLVIGIGLNVGNSLKEAPTDVQAIATSLLDETGVQYSLMEVLIRLLKILEGILQSLGRSELPLQARWARQCTLSGHDVRLQAGDQVIRGRCAGLGPQGGLLIVTEEGAREWFGGVARRVTTIE